MDNIILYLLTIIQEQYKTICWLLNFICKYIPLRQWAFDGSHSLNTRSLLPTASRSSSRSSNRTGSFSLNTISGSTANPSDPFSVAMVNPSLKIPSVLFVGHLTTISTIIMAAMGSSNSKVCGQTFVTGEVVTSPLRFVCPYCGHSLVPNKDRKFFRIHKCVNPGVPSTFTTSPGLIRTICMRDYGKTKYKPHYLYREFTVDFFRMDLDSLPENSSSLKFSKHNAHIMSLCLTMHVNLQLSLRKTAQALYDPFTESGSHISRSPTMPERPPLSLNPLLTTMNIQSPPVFTADETYIKVRGIKGYIWFIMDAASRSILGYQVSDNRSVGPCILAMRMASPGHKKTPREVSVHCRRL